MENIDKNIEFARTLTKGRIAESLIQELFLCEGYEIFRYGLENLYQGLYRKITNLDIPQAVRVRKSPDFIVYNKTIEPNRKTPSFRFIETKLSGSRYFQPELFDDYEACFPHTIFMIVTPGTFYAVPVNKLKNKAKNFFKNMGQFSLENDTRFNFRKETIAAYQNLSSELLTEPIINK